MYEGDWHGAKQDGKIGIFLKKVKKGKKDRIQDTEDRIQNGVE